MSEFFLKIVNMSISASWLVLAVLLLRLILKKAPKWVNVLLWGIVAIRLVCPFSLESALSLIPSAETVSPEIMMDRTPEISTGIDSFDAVVNPIITESFAPQPMASANPLQIWIPVSANFWLLGIGIMLIYTAISYLLLRRKVATAIRLEGNIYQSENVASPFVLGIIKPKIYLPFRMDAGNLQHVIAHEQAHIRRKDHLWKPLGFLLLAIHWFNPMMWLGYIFLCKDIELACDEKVIGKMDSETKADYTQALVACSVNRRSIAACPLAFGEVDVKARVKSILHYKKPAFWIIVAAIVICAAVAVCFLTDPANSPKLSMTGNRVSDMDVDALLKRIHKVERLSDQNIYTNANNFHLTVDGQFEWVDSQAMRYFFRDEDKTHSGQVQIFPKEQQYHIVKSAEWTEQEQIFLLRHYLNALKYLPTTAIRETVSADRYVIRHVEEGTPGDYPRVIMYSPEGVWNSENWLVHLQLDPLHKDGEGFSGSGDESIHLFYWDAADKKEVLELTAIEGYVTAGSVNSHHPCSIRLTKQRTDPDSYYNLCIEVVSASKVWRKELEAATDPLAEGSLYSADIDGDQVQEILVHNDAGGLGGFGIYQVWVLKPENDDLRTLFYSDSEFDSEFDTGFESRFLEGHQLEVKNRFTGYKQIFDATVYKEYIDGSDRLPEGNINLDPFYVFQPTDIDGDGISEIMCKQYTNILDHADYTGSACSVLKFNQKTQSFEVVKAWFEINTEPDYDAAVRPEQITGIVKATLELPRSWDAPRTVTDPETLGKIERILRRSKVLESGANCLFTGRLTLTLASGETLILTMSEDNCATWRSEGVCYTYSLIIFDVSKNDELYDLFTVQ